jgi:N-acetylated-alpha-linked acidic dipeptidase
LSEKVVAYINSDANGRGFINAGGSHTLEPFFNEIITAVPDLQTGVSIGERRHAKLVLDADAAGRTKLLGNKQMKLSALGAGSDYSPFFQHLGIASMNLGFGGEDPAGVYHSIYDNYNHYTRFGDPGFHYGIALAKTAGRITLRLANADVLPFDFGTFYKTVADYATEVKTVLDNMRTETETETKLLRGNIFTIANDPSKKRRLPQAHDAVPYLNFSPLENALHALKQTTDSFSKAHAAATALPAGKQEGLNTILYKAERSLLQPAGLPRRSWYKHQIYAPGFYTGYGVKTLPGIREAIEQRAWKEAQVNIDTVAQTLEAYNKQVQQATLLLQQAL